ncbi:DUF3597 domain-containing protein [Acidisphaera sp. L21]|uniref:DUF3597 domain-containing protein n=1 Tax=Acidisphaera sp. L21 TaxID=1641851 RepID=UPI00131E3489|nr:DUF3597 domain-containing protein [Acidisphaera sp. L21]
MSIFSSIMSKIFHAGAPAAGSIVDAISQTAPETVSEAVSPSPTTTPDTGSKTVDVGVVLSQLASQKGGGGNYESSIVDLLKLLDLDSSLEARKELATELNVHVGADGSAEENVALHKAVVQKLEENGGKVPDSMKA